MGSFNTYDTELARFFGLSTGIFLSAIIIRATDEEEYIVLNNEFFKELGLTDKDIKNARTILKENGILKEKRGKGIGYAINTKVMYNVIERGLPPKETTISSSAIISMAFRKVGLNTPPLTGGNNNMAKSLLQVYKAEDIAGCWKDIIDGNYRKESIKWLNFYFLARNPNVIDGWLEWKKNGGKTQLRLGERDKDVEEIKKYAGF